MATPVAPPWTWRGFSAVPAFARFRGGRANSEPRFGWRIVRVVKPELGQKRVCTSCGAKFYDLNHDPITCPKCGTVFDATAVVKTRRARAVVEDKPAKAVKKSPKHAEVADIELPDAAIDDTVEDEEEEEGVIEDASELGEDEDDMAEVIENVDEEGER